MLHSRPQHMLHAHFLASSSRHAVGRTAAATVLRFVPARVAEEANSIGLSQFRTSALGATPGLSSAILSPAASALGFMLWDKNWLGSAFALNFAKNVIASVFYCITLTATGAMPSFQPGDASMIALPFLALSAFLGVVIGDSTSIASLKRLGARRYLLIDCMRPALAQLIGVFFFSEKITIRLVAGITAVISGVYIASAAKMPAANADASTKNNKGLAHGYALAGAHLVLDTVGASISKAYGSGLGPLNICLLRFGSAALMLGAMSVAAQGWSSLVRSKQEPSEALESAPKVEASAPKDEVVTNAAKWWQLPSNMSRKNWAGIVCGTFFVTFIAPSLFVRSILLMPLGLAMTLSCMAPLYEPLLARIIRGVRAEPQAVFGALFACAGVAILCV